MGSVYGVRLPSDVNALMEQFSVLVSFGLQGVATTPLACVGLSGYVPRLLFWMVLPPVLSLLVVVGVVLMTLRQRRMARKRTERASRTSKKDSKALGRERSGRLPVNQKNALIIEEGDEEEEQVRQTSIFEKCLPLMLKVLFVLYPMVTRVAFNGFPCFNFANGRGWLMADVSIECYTPEYTKVSTLAWIAVIVYPIGLWLFNLLLLLKASKAIISGNHTPLSRAISFLYVEYDRETFWWEVLLEAYLLEPKPRTQTAHAV